MVECVETALAKTNSDQPQTVGVRGAVFVALRRVPAAGLRQCSHPRPPPILPSSCLCSAVLCWCLSDRLTPYLDLEAHFRHFSCRQYRWPRRRRTFPALVYRALPRTTPADFSCVPGLEATSTAPLKHEPTVGSRVSPGFSLDRPAADVLRLYWLP